jgi:two-component system LytT family response regulator
MPLTTIIIDDEALARDRIRNFLKSHEKEITLVAEADNGYSALEVIRSHRPDLIFLDIQMPEMDGLSMLAELASDERPSIIFITAYDEYAVKAFELHALDYLLKPFSRERFNATIERAKQECATPLNLTEKLDALLNHLPTTSPPSPAPLTTRLTIKDQGRMYFVNLDDILWIEAAGNYAEIHDSQRTHLLRETMTHLEKRLPPEDFIRVNRSAIVRIDAIAEIRSYAKGDYYVTLTSGTKVKSTIPLKDLQTKLEQH